MECVVGMVDSKTDSRELSNGDLVECRRTINVPDVCPSSLLAKAGDGLDFSMTAGEWLACYQDQVREETRARSLVVLEFFRYHYVRNAVVKRWEMVPSPADCTPPSVTSMVASELKRVHSDNKHAMRLKVKCVSAAKPFTTQQTRPQVAVEDEY